MERPVSSCATQAVRIRKFGGSSPADSCLRGVKFPRTEECSSRNGPGRPRNAPEWLDPGILSYVHCPPKGVQKRGIRPYNGLNIMFQSCFSHLNLCVVFGSPFFGSPSGGRRHASSYCASWRRMANRLPRATITTITTI